MWSRIHLIPLLQAEEDRDVVRRHYAQQKMEEELLGKSQSVYHGDRYVEMVNGEDICGWYTDLLCAGLCDPHMLLHLRTRQSRSGIEDGGICGVLYIPGSLGELNDMRRKCRLFPFVYRWNAFNCFCGVSFGRSSFCLREISSWVLTTHGTFTERPRDLPRTSSTTLPCAQGSPFDNPADGRDQAALRQLTTPEY